MLILLPLFPGMRAREKTLFFSISNNNKGIYSNFISYVIFFPHDQAMGSLEAGSKTFTDPWKMLMLAVAICQQLHKKEEKPFVLLRQLMPEKGQGKQDLL